MCSYVDTKLLLTEHLWGDNKWLLTEHDRFLALYLMKYLLIQFFNTSILLEFPSLYTDSVLFISVIIKNNKVLGFPTSITTIKVHGTVNQTHGTFHQTITKIWLKWLGQFVKQMVQFIKPLQNIDKHGKQSSLEEYFVKNIGTRPPISCHVSPIGKNKVITNTNIFR